MPLINPFHKQLCLFCFEPFSLRDCAVVSSQTIDPTTQTYQVLRAAPQGLTRALAQVYVGPLDRPQYMRELATWRCPNCGELLPYNVTTTPSYVIGVIGGRAAGKSHYIATLIQALSEQGVMSQFRWSEFSGATGEVSRRFASEYAQPLFQERAELLPTPPARSQRPYKPLIYTLTSRAANNGEAPRSVNLVLFDVSGEQFSSDAEIARFAPFVPYAAGFILLVDPLTMSGVVPRLPAHLRPLTVPGERAVVVLEHLIRIIRRHKRLDDGTPIAAPLVVTVAKSDLLKYVLPNLGRHPLLEAPDYSQGFDLAVFRALSEQIEDLCLSLDGPRLIELARIFTRHAYSAVSATGHGPNAEGYFGRSVNPIRSLDPLLWLLAELGLIKAQGYRSSEKESEKGGARGG